MNWRTQRPKAGHSTFLLWLCRYNVVDFSAKHFNTKMIWWSHKFRKLSNPLLRSFKDSFCVAFVRSFCFFVLFFDNMINPKPILVHNHWSLWFLVALIQYFWKKVILLIVLLFFRDIQWVNCIWDLLRFFNVGHFTSSRSFLTVWANFIRKLKAYFCVNWPFTTTKIWCI